MKRKHENSAPPGKRRGVRYYASTLEAPKTRAGRRIEKLVKYVVPLASVIVAIAAATITFANWQTIKAVNHKAQDLQEASLTLQALNGALASGQVLAGIHSKYGLGNFSITYITASDKPLYVTEVKLSISSQSFPTALQNKFKSELKHSCAVSVWAATGTTVHKKRFACTETFAIPPGALLFVDGQFDGKAAQASCERTRQQYAEVTVEVTTLPAQEELANYEVSAYCRNLTADELSNGLSSGDTSSKSSYTSATLIKLGISLLIIGGAGLLALQYSKRMAPHRSKATIIACTCVVLLGILFIVIRIGLTSC